MSGQLFKDVKKEPSYYLEELTQQLLLIDNHVKNIEMLQSKEEFSDIFLE